VSIVLKRSALAVAFVAGLVAAGTVAPAAAETYPSWDDVAAAKSNSTSAQAQVDRINGLLAGLQSAVDAAADRAIERAAAYAAAEAAREAATRRAGDLTERARSATATASTVLARSGALAAQLSRGGGSDVALRLFVSENGAQSDALLYRLGAVARLAEQSNTVYAQAAAQKNLAVSLSAQADSAEEARQRLEAEAESASTEAASAKAAADAALAEQRSRADTMYAQLASLKNTEASVERLYAEGVAARQAAEQAAGSGSGGGSGSGSGGGGADGSAPPPGVVVNPVAAQEYAASRLAAYRWGSDQMGCLIRLWTKESSWRADAYNTSSGAYGIPQALPGSKMAAAGSDWMTNANTQIDWGLSYISGRYGSPCAAWSFHLGHNWY
jgi:hypothetical protein